MEAVDVDWGRLEFEVSQVDLVLHSPFYSRGRPKKGNEASLVARHSPAPKGGMPGDAESRAGRKVSDDEKQGPQAWWNQVQEFVQDRLKGELK